MLSTPPGCLRWAALLRNERFNEAEALNGSWAGPMRLRVETAPEGQSCSNTGKMDGADAALQMDAGRWQEAAVPPTGEFPRSSESPGSQRPVQPTSVMTASYPECAMCSHGATVPCRTLGELDSGVLPTAQVRPGMSPHPSSSGGLIGKRLLSRELIG